MGIRNLLAGKPKTEKLLKQAQSLLDKGKPKEAKRILAKLAFGVGDAETVADERERQYRAHYYELLAKAQLALDESEAIKTILIAHSLKPNEGLLQEGVSLVERKELLGPEATKLVLTLNEVTDGERGFLLSYAKRLVAHKSSNLTSDEHEVVLAATKTFTLWKGGSDLLAEEFLAAGRTDPEAVSVYRIAYPNRKGDKRILEKLVSHFKQTKEKTDFSAQVFEDYLSQGYEDQEVLGLLTQYYIEKSEITPQTIERIVKAVESGLLDKFHLEKLSLYILRTRKEFLDKKSLLLAIYRAGYYNKNVLAFLALAFAEEGNFSDEAIKAYEDALKNNLLTNITLVPGQSADNHESTCFCLRITCKRNEPTSKLRAYTKRLWLITQNLRRFFLFWQQATLLMRRGIQRPTPLTKEHTQCLMTSTSRDKLHCFWRSKELKTLTLIREP